MGYQTLIDKAVSKGGDTDQRFTRQPDFLLVERMFGVKFTLDVCAVNAQAAKCSRFYAPKQTAGCLGVDGLAQPWGGEVVWDNCPWSNITPWARRHWTEPARLSVLYVPNDRAERGWWQKYVEPFLPSSMKYDPARAARQHGFDLHGVTFKATNLDYRPAFDVPGGGSAGEQPMCGVVVLSWDRRRG